MNGYFGTNLENPPVLLSFESEPSYSNITVDTKN